MTPGRRRFAARLNVQRLSRAGLVSHACRLRRHGDKPWRLARIAPSDGELEWSVASSRKRDGRLLERRAPRRRLGARRDRWHRRSCKLGRASSRREILTKAAAYEVVRQHIMYRLRKGIDACNAGASGVADWEIGYALHAGSLEGTDGSGSGKSTYALGDKRCPQFDTCVAGTRIATNNQKALDAWQSGVTALAATNCFTALTASETILAQLTVPLVQGMVREAYEVDPNGGAATADGVVEVAEGWAFTTAILPQIAMCNASIAQLIRTNMALSLDGTNGAHVAPGFRVVKSAIESQYPCLKITCADVGGMLASGAPIAGMEPCVDGAGSLPPAAPAPAAVPSPPIPECPSSSGIIIVLIVLLVLALVALVALALCMLCRKGGGESKEFSGITMNRT